MAEFFDTQDKALKGYREVLHLMIEKQPSRNNTAGDAKRLEATAHITIARSKGGTNTALSVARTQRAWNLEAAESAPIVP